MKIAPVTSIEHLRERVKAGQKDYAILLAGGLAYSRKTIKLDKQGCWVVKNHIDGTTQHLCANDGLWSESNIGEALDKEALVEIV